MLKFVPMTASDFERYMQAAVINYADEQVRAGSWPTGDAVARAEKAFKMLLPEGLATANQSLCNLIDIESSERIGTIWYGVLEEETGVLLALYDFEILESHRRRGYGAQALEALELEAKTRGIRRIALHVFGHNTAARALYQKAGYEETHVTMIKDLTA